MKNQWDAFDCELATSLSALPPPEKTVRDVTPFRDAVSRIVLGLCLTWVTLNVWYLQYLLPALGTLQLYFGFRALRRNNRWFRLAWIFSICKVILLYIYSILDATPLSGALPVSWTVLSAGTTLALFLTFHLGLTQAAREVGQPLQRRPALWAAVWYAVLMVLAIAAPDIGWLGFIPMIVAFVSIVRSMLRVSRELEDWGYSVRAAPAAISTKGLTVLYLTSLLLLILLCAAVSNHLPMDPEPVSEISSPEMTAIQTRLTDQGFPEELLARLPEEELKRLSGASRCVTALNQGNTGSKKGSKAFRFDTVYVQTDPHTFRVYEFFSLRQDTLRSNWRVLAQLDPSSTVSVSDVAGGITWTQDANACRSSPVIQTRLHEDFFFGPSSLPTMEFSYPFLSRDRGGYMAYTASLDSERILFSSVLRTYLTTARNFYPYVDLTTDFFQTDWYAQSYSVCDTSPD